MREPLRLRPAGSWAPLSPLTVSDWSTVFQGISRERLSLKLSSLSTSCITVIAVRRFSKPFAKTAGSS